MNQYLLQGSILEIENAKLSRTEHPLTTSTNDMLFLLGSGIEPN